MLECYQRMSSRLTQCPNELQTIKSELEEKNMEDEAKKILSFYNLNGTEDERQFNFNINGVEISNG